MKEYPIIDYLDLIRTEQNNIDVSDLDIAYLYNQLTSSLSIPKKYFEQTGTPENKFFGKFINKK